MGSMERMIKSRHTKSEMLTLNTCFEDKSKYLTQFVAANNGKNVNEEFSIYESASVENLREACRAYCSPVPTRPRSYRVDLGKVTYNSESDNYLCNNSQKIVDEKNPRKSNEKESYNSEEGVYHLSRSHEMIVDDEKNSRKCKERSRDADFIIVSDDDYGEEESSKKKRQKKGEKKTTVPRKPVQIYNLPTELPQNLQKYTNGLNLEVQPLFVAQKLLTVTDIDSNQNRLSLPMSLISFEFLENFLTKDEKELLKRKMPVEVNLVDNMIREYKTLRMAKWDLTSSWCIVLRTAWSDVVAKNKLKIVKVLKDKKVHKIVGMEDDNKLVTDVVARVWSFRRESNLWFALSIQAMADIKILGMTDGIYVIP